MVMKGTNSIYISPNGASSSLVMLPTQPSLPEAQPREEEEGEYQVDRVYTNMPITPLTTSFRRSSSTQMARSSSQKRINMELSLGASGQASSPRGLRTPTNFPSGDDYRFPSGTPTRQVPTRRNSARIASLNGTMTSQSNSNATSLASSSNRDYFGPDVCSSELVKVPFPSSSSMSTTVSTSCLDSPSIKRVSRHVSLTGAAAASVESINLIPASPPKNAGPIPIPSRPAFRHLRYSSDLHVSRNQMMAASRSDVSMEDKSRLRLDSEAGSLYTNTLGSFTNEELTTSSSNLRMVRDSSQSSALNAPPAAKHKLIVVEEGKANVTYQMGNCIGRGQFGSVYRALNLNTGQMVAVKRIKLEGLVEDEVMQLMGEVDLLKSLSHPSVVKYEGLVRGSDVVSIILEFVENGSLLHTLKAFGNFPEKLVASYVVKILEGLNYLHEMKVVHCDLKAANILTTKNGNVKLSDFGVSLNLKAVKNIKNDAIGTPNWMAPEVIELKGVSTAADIWSLGCTIIELLTGKPPYGDMLAMSALWRIVEDDCPPFPDKISEPLRDFLSLCFNKDPTLRPSAEMLFEHIWLRGTWNTNMDLRPQDSVPFLRRISADARALHLTGSTRARHMSTSSNQSKMERSTSSPSATLSLRPHLLSMRAASAPDAWSTMQPIPISAIEEGSMSLSSEQASPLTPSANPMTSSPPSMSLVDLGLRRGSDPGGGTFDMLQSPNSLVATAEKDALGKPPSSEPSFLDLNGPEPFPTDEINKTHAFVKITFGKAVVCKICRDPVKKHAVLCEECGLICHASCTKKASTPCNLRAQLLIYAANQGAASRGSMDLIRGISPSPGHGSGAISPPLSSGQDTPPLSPRLFKMSFARTKKMSNAAAGLSIPINNNNNNNNNVDTPTAQSPMTPTTQLPLSDGGTPSSQQRRRRFSLRPYLGSRRQSPSPAPVVDASMARSLSSTRSNPIQRSREDLLGYGSSISSGSSSMPGAMSMTKTDTSTSDSVVPPTPTKKIVPPRYRHSVQITAAASTSHLLSLEKEKEAERRAKRRQSASVQRVTTPTEIPFPSLHSTGATSPTPPPPPPPHHHPHRHQQSKSSNMPPITSSSAKRSRRLSSKQDCIVM